MRKVKKSYFKNSDISAIKSNYIIFKDQLNNTIKIIFFNYNKNGNYAITSIQILKAKKKK